MKENSSAVEVFVPMDRRQALAKGERLPDRSNGAVLFADVSGFTPLTAALNEKLGPELGAEELTRHLNQVFEHLITDVHNYGGSVIVFSGDAITCWFEGDNGRRATACALGMHQEMKHFVNLPASGGVDFSLALKVAVTAGMTRRFLVGQTDIQRLEVLAGTTIDRVAAAEQLLNKGETIVGAEIIAWFGNNLHLVEWRSDGRGEHFAVVDRLSSHIPPKPWPPVSLDPNIGRSWVMPPVAERALRGEGEYLSQLRSSVAMFLKFGDIDYDKDEEAGAKLDKYIQWVQTVLAQYEGYLLELTIGDKGSYLYIVFGTPLTHENDPARAISAALNLQNPPADLTFCGPVQIGISQGTMRAGAYGSSQRRSYSVQGQEVNIAARLMSQAKPGQILVSGRILKGVVDQFEFDSLGLLPLKGLQEPLSVYKVLGEKINKVVTETVKNVGSPLVGRGYETALFQEQLDELKAGQGSTIVIEGEAGVGKSRLVAEFLNETEKRGIQSLVGAGNEMTQSVAYHACRSAFQQLFGLRAEDDTVTAWSKVTDWLRLGLNEELLMRVPLLNVILPFQIPESAFTFQLSGELRANNTYDLLVSVMKRAIEKGPLVLVLEDGQWLDTATWALIERLKWEALPLLLVLVTRPFGGTAAHEEITAQYEHLLAAPDTRLILLKPLPQEQTVQLVCNRLGVSALPENVGELIHARAEGLPFFSEELAVALRDTGLLRIRNGTCQLTTGLDELYKLGFPNTIQKAITSRIDRLPPPQQLTLKVSSVVGRIFNYQTLYDVYPVAADQPLLDSYLDRLEKLAIIRMREQNQGGLVLSGTSQAARQYIFRNAITRDIAYSLLLFEQRRQLHKAVGEWYEARYAADLTDHFGILAYHWQQSDSPVRAVQYLAKAGEQALKNGAYQEAVNFLSRLLELTDTYETEWQLPDGRLSRETQLAVWHRQLSQGYSGIGQFTQTIVHARKTLALLGRPEPQGQTHLLVSFAKEIIIQTRHRLQPGRFLGSCQDDTIILEQGRAALLLTEAYFFKDQFLSAFHAGILTLNRLELAETGSFGLVNSLSNFIVGMSAIPRNPLLSYYERLARQAVAETNSLEARALFQFRLGIYYAGVGRWDVAERIHLDAIEIYEQLGHLRMRIECLTILGIFRSYQGKFSLLDTMGKEVYNLANRQGNQQWMVWGLNLVAIDWLYTAEDSSQAFGYLESSAELMGDQEFGLTRELYLGWLALALLRLGELEKARQAVEQIRNLLGVSPPFSAVKLEAYTAPPLVYLTIWEQAGANVQRETVKLARAACRALARFALIFPIGRPRSYLYWGLNHWLSGRKGYARSRWQKSLESAVQLDMPYDEALAHFELGRHLPAGDAERERYLRKAEEIFERLDTQYDLLRCRDVRENGRVYG
ncbi:MAG: AAA family ATPase [Candidatus Promineifilaceae bacterium]